MTTVMQALLSLCPGSQWSIVGEDLTTLEWLDEVNVRPSDSAINAEIVRLEAVVPVPQVISDRQFFQQLAIDGIITEDQALASNAAIIPPPLLALIEGMPEDQQFAVKMLVSGATQFERSHPVTLAIGASYGWDSDQIDTFFRAAAAL